MAHAQRVAIMSALHATNHNLSETARHLRIGRTTLYRLLQEYQISIEKTAGRRSAGARGSPGDRHEPRVRLVDGIWYLEGARSGSPTHQ